MIALFACLGSGNLCGPCLALNPLNIPSKLRLVDLRSKGQMSDWVLRGTAQSTSSTLNPFFRGHLPRSKAKNDARCFNENGKFCHGAAPYCAIAARTDAMRATLGFCPLPGRATTLGNAA